MNLAVADLFTLNIYGLQGSLVTSLAHGLSSSGLFPLNLGIFGIVDGVSLFTSMVVLLLNKFIYVIIVDYLPLGRLGNYVINDITFT